MLNYSLIEQTLFQLICRETLRSFEAQLTSISIAFCNWNLQRMFSLSFQIARKANVMNQIEAFLPVIRVFQLLGLSPFSVDEKFWPKESRNLRFFSLFQIGCFFVSLLGTFSKRELFLSDTQSDVAHLVDFVQLMGVRVAHLIILCESLIHQKSLISFFESLCEIDEMMKKVKIDEYPKKKSFVYVGLVVSFYFGAQIVVIWILILREEFHRLSYVWFYILPFLVICIRDFQIISCVGFIKKRFELINQRLEEIVLNDDKLSVVLSYPSLKTSSTFKLYTSDLKSFKQPNLIKNAKQLLLIRQMYEKLYVLSTIVNYSFGLSNIVNIAKGFTAITINLYYIFLRFQIVPLQGLDVLIACIQSFFWLLPHMVNIILLSAACHYTSLTVT